MQYLIDSTTGQSTQLLSVLKKSYIMWDIWFKQACGESYLKLLVKCKNRKSNLNLEIEVNLEIEAHMSLRMIFTGKFDGKSNKR